MLHDGRGGGASNLVLLGQDRDLDQRVVVKAARLEEEAEEVAILREEIQIQQNLTHANLVPLLYACETPSEVLLVTPFAAGGDLHAALGQSGTLNELQAGRLCAQLLEGLAYLHEKLSVLHGDIKPRNIFLVPCDGACVAQLGDFGLSREVPRKAPHLCTFHGLQGSHGYMAPEIIAQEDYGTAVDLFALGVIMFSILGGYDPFYPASNVHAPLEFDESAWGWISEDAASFVSSLLRVAPEERLPAVQGLGHPWILGLEAKAEEIEQKKVPPSVMTPADLRFHPVHRVPEVLPFRRGISVT